MHSAVTGIIGMSSIELIPANIETKIESLHPYSHTCKHNATVTCHGYLANGWHWANTVPTVE